MSKRYRVAFKGEVVAGCPVSDVKASFCERFNKNAETIERIFGGEVKTLAKEMKFRLDTPWSKLPEKVRQVILHGSGGKELTFEIDGKKSSFTWTGEWEGVIPVLERRHKDTDSAAVRTEIGA